MAYIIIQDDCLVSKFTQLLHRSFDTLQTKVIWPLRNCCTNTRCRRCSL